MPAVACCVVPTRSGSIPICGRLGPQSRAAAVVVGDACPASQLEGRWVNWTSRSLDHFPAETLIARAESAITAIFVRANTLFGQISNLVNRIDDDPAAAPSDWYFPTTDRTGRHVDPLRLEALGDPKGPAINRNRAQVIKAVLALREALDEADAAVDKVAPLITSGSTNERWAESTKARIDAVRAAIVSGHGDRNPPSCVPIPSADTHDSISAATRALDAQLVPLRLEREQIIARVRDAELVFQHPTGAIILRSTPHTWQRVQIVLDLVCLECEEGREVELDRLGQIAADGLTVVGRDIEKHIPIGLLDGGGTGSALCAHKCSEIKTLLGSLARASRNGFSTAMRSDAMARASALSDWIEGTLRPYYPEKWVKAPNLRKANELAIAIAEVYAGLFNLADTVWRTESTDDQIGVARNRLIQALANAPTPPEKSVAAAISRLKRIGRTGSIPGSRLGFPGIHDQTTKKDVELLVHWWNAVVVGAEGTPPRVREGNRKRTSKPSLVLRDRHLGPIVCGTEKPVLTPARYDVIDCLISAGAKGLTGNRLVTTSRHGDAVNILKALAATDDDWKQVVSLPGKPNAGYRIDVCLDCQWVLHVRHDRRRRREDRHARRQGRRSRDLCHAQPG